MGTAGGEPVLSVQPNVFGVSRPPLPFDGLGEAPPHSATLCCRIAARPGMVARDTFSFPSPTRSTAAPMSDASTGKASLWELLVEGRYCYLITPATVLALGRHTLVVRQELLLEPLRPSPAAGMLQTGSSRHLHSFVFLLWWIPKLIFPSSILYPLHSQLGRVLRGSVW